MSARAVFHGLAFEEVVTVGIGEKVAVARRDYLEFAVAAAFVNQAGTT